MLKEGDIITCINGHPVAVVTKDINKDDIYANFIDFIFETPNPYGKHGKDVHCAICKASFYASIDITKDTDDIFKLRTTYPGLHTKDGWVFHDKIYTEEEFEKNMKEQEKSEMRGNW